MPQFMGHREPVSPLLCGIFEWIKGLVDRNPTLLYPGGPEHIVTTEVADLHAVRDALERAGIQVSSAELTRIPKAEVAVSGGTATKLVRLLEALEALDDVQKVYSNADIDEAVLAGVE